MTPVHVDARARDRLLWREGDFWLMTPAWEPAWSANPTPVPEQFDPTAGSLERVRAAARIAEEMRAYRLHDDTTAWRAMVSPAWELLDAQDLIGCVLVDRAPVVVSMERGHVRASAPRRAVPVELRLPAGMHVLPIGAIGSPPAHPSELLVPPDVPFEIVRATQRSIVALAVASRPHGT